jgi:hypothetical protein
MKKNYLLLITIAVSTLATVSLGQDWRPVSGSRQANISGMALIQSENGRSSFLVVHDNKKKEQIHAEMLTIDGSESPKVTPLDWVGNDIPTDLEAVCSVPASPGQFMAFTAAGRVFHIKLDVSKHAVTVLRSFDVPAIPAEADFEGFELQSIDNTLIAVWADRGATAKPATIFWSKFDLSTDKFSDVASTPFRIPFPVANVRHVSDIKVDTTGAAFVTAASDPGNDGPFTSAAYFAGVFRVDSQRKVTFALPAGFSPLYRFARHKVEAFEFVPGTDGGLVFGTDDENLGASLLLTF